jgi:DNA-binding NarL/FixJ family response regulator
MQTIRILIADDHPVVRSGLQTMLAQTEDFEVIGAVANGRQAIQHIEAHSPDVVLMDLRMPEMDGVEAVHHIREHHPETRVLVLTTYKNDRDVLAALDAGATGYLLKDTPKATLLNAIRAAARGESVLDPEVEPIAEGRSTPPADALTPREIEVLQLVAAGNTNAQVAQQLFISETTVKTHLKHIYRKLNADDRAAAVAIAVEKRLIRADPE